MGRPLKREGSKADQQAHDDGIKHPGQHSGLSRVRLAFQKLAHVSDLLCTELLIRDQMDEEQLGRSLEQFACQVPQGTCLRGPLLDGGEISMATPLLFMADISLAFKRAQDRQHCGVSQLAARRWSRKSARRWGTSWLTPQC